MNRIIDFGGGSLPLISSLLAYGCGVLRYPLLLQVSAFKCINHGLHGWHGLGMYVIPKGNLTVIAQEFINHERREMNHLKSQFVISSPSRSRSQSVILKNECVNHGTHGIEMGVV